MPDYTFVLTRCGCDPSVPLFETSTLILNIISLGSFDFICIDHLAAASTDTVSTVSDKVENLVEDVAHLRANQDEQLGKITADIHRMSADIHMLLKAGGMSASVTASALEQGSATRPSKPESPSRMRARRKSVVSAKQDQPAPAHDTPRKAVVEREASPPSRHEPQRRLFDETAPAPPRRSAPSGKPPVLRSPSLMRSATPPRGFP